MVPCTTAAIQGCSFDSGNDEPGWIERHDEFFAGRGEGGERYGNKK